MVLTNLNHHFHKAAEEYYEELVFIYSEFQSLFKLNNKMNFK